MHGFGISGAGENQAGYWFSLADGNKWHLTGEPELFPWLERLAYITQLENGRPEGRSSRIHFRPMSEPLTSLAEISFSPSSGQSDWTVWEHESLYLSLHKATSDATCEVDNRRGFEPEIMNMLHGLQPVYMRSIAIGGLPFHAALLEYHGTGLLLAAVGGTGKSTCCRRAPDPWRPICDDEVLVVRDEEGRYRVHPFPTWGDYLWGRGESRWDIQQSIPLRAIFFLTQGEGDVTRPIEEGRAAARISESSRQVCQRFWQRMSGEPKRALTTSIFFNACEFTKKVPTFALEVSLNGKFWEVLERTLDEDY